jgi:hypothetical protein
MTSFDKVLIAIIWVILASILTKKQLKINGSDEIETIFIVIFYYAVFPIALLVLIIKKIFIEDWNKK